MSITPTEHQVPVSGATFRVLEAGPAGADPILFLHGWPEDASAWTAVMDRAADQYRCLAVDLPGIGGSSIPQPRGDKVYLASLVHELVGELGLRRLTLVGHDAGGMTTFAYLKQFAGPDRDPELLRAAVIMDTVVPGIDPWEKVLANPYIWHFALHSIPQLPETLVQNNIRAYFDFFYDVISARKDALTDEARDRYVRSYAKPEALQQGFELYRAFRQDAADNSAETGPLETPVLYLRGTAEGGELADYEQGFRAAGLQHLTTGLVDGAGHFAPEEAPDEVWSLIAEHLARV